MTTPDLTWHTPIRPARSLPGEQAFLREWRHLMRPSPDGGDETTVFDEVLADKPGPRTRREAQVLASVVTWFGTNVGLAFLLEAQRMKQRMPRVRWPYLGQWGQINVRQIGINEGVRTLEHCLATERYKDGLGHDAWRIPELSADDYETVEHLMVWLSSETGQAFLARCERETEAERLQLSPSSRAALGLPARVEA